MSKSVDIVIAHYKEDLSWLPVHETDFQFHIYAKHFNQDYYTYFKNHHENVGTVATLPNVGRESHTYLYHIVSNYDKIAENPGNVTVFLQGNIHDHLKFYNSGAHSQISEFELVQLFVEQARELGKSQNYARVWDMGWYSAHKDLYIPAREGLQVCGQNFGSWFTTHIASVFPDLLKWWIAALFAVRNDQIIKRPKSYYVSLLSQVDSHQDPDVGHYFERSWFYIFQ